MLEQGPIYLEQGLVYRAIRDTIDKWKIKLGLVEKNPVQTAYRILVHPADYDWAVMAWDDSQVLPSISPHINPIEASLQCERGEVLLPQDEKEYWLIVTGAWRMTVEQQRLAIEGMLENLSKLEDE